MKNSHDSKVTVVFVLIKLKPTENIVDEYMAACKQI